MDISKLQLILCL